ncbi:Sjoegren syndrome nuclear autoantigen 1 [Eurytemora carolleeae]|uniref:Sjoegren syndrome nuclear autoantigen 1 n=1 Tax=Eurytemora carolleeae TaxID=1294199 RepID=UPI000C778980|nr:Sjoegren syndrome nuclear autoantigen 1 [Eurytemora carolleeae]XP_023319659.1 Sjoegren syndrome nuclear autoantigen 1 [Eurytemora carolleeae]|eukprot:XP_023319658.1 Sjoegren syndrome nuclear autoantigen 1-like [Eurytemora affinis]
MRMPQLFLKFSQVATISDKMARQGAALQNYNNELVKSLEELCQRRHNLQNLIDVEEAEKRKLEEEKRRIDERLQVVTTGLEQKLGTKAEYDRVIGEAEGAYMKILESSQILLNAVKLRSDDLKTSGSRNNLKVSSTTPDSGYHQSSNQPDSRP